MFQSRQSQHAPLAFIVLRSSANVQNHASWPDPVRIRGKIKLASLLDLQALQLLRAFFRIGDPQRRQEIILDAEEFASSTPHAFPRPTQQIGNSRRDT